jgi:hypothetical protein
MATAQEKLGLAIVTKLRADTGAGSLVTLTGHSATKLRIGMDKPVKKGETPYFGVAVFTSVPVSDNGPSHVQVARIHFLAYSTKPLTATQLADRIEHLLHARDEQDAGRTNTEFYDFSSGIISNRQTRWKRRDQGIYDDDTEVWKVLVEAELIWLDEPCT